MLVRLTFDQGTNSWPNCMLVTDCECGGSGELITIHSPWGISILFWLYCYRLSTEGITNRNTGTNQYNSDKSFCRSSAQCKMSVGSNKAVSLPDRLTAIQCWSKETQLWSMNVLLATGGAGSRRNKQRINFEVYSKLSPLLQWGHQKFLIQSCVSFDQHCITRLFINAQLIIHPWHSN